MEHHPSKNMDLVDEAYFQTMDECETWCILHPEMKLVNFEIHHSIGATNYRSAMGTGTGVLNWITRDYNEHNFPRIRPWWSIFDVPSEIDVLCQKEKL